MMGLVILGGLIVAFVALMAISRASGDRSLLGARRFGNDSVHQFDSH